MQRPPPPGEPEPRTWWTGAGPDLAAVALILAATVWAVLLPTEAGGWLAVGCAMGAGTAVLLARAAAERRLRAERERCRLALLVADLDRHRP